MQPIVRMDQIAYICNVIYNIERMAESTQIVQIRKKPLKNQWLSVLPQGIETILIDNVLI